MDTHTRLKVLDRLISIFSSDQRNMAKAKVENRYEALDDPEHSGLSEDQIRSLQKAKDDHVANVKKIIDRTIMRVQDRIYTYKDTDFEMAYELEENRDDVKAKLIEYGREFNKPILERAVTVLPYSIVRDILKPYVQHLTEPAVTSDLVFYDAPFSRNAWYMFENVIAAAQGLDTDTLNGILATMDTRTFDTLVFVERQGKLNIEAIVTVGHTQIGVPNRRVSALSKELDRAIAGTTK